MSVSRGYTGLEKIHKEQYQRQHWVYKRGALSNTNLGARAMALLPFSFTFSCLALPLYGCSDRQMQEKCAEEPQTSGQSNLL